MKLLADLHTHSKFSRFGHGKNTIEEMARRANELGLEELAITDHGYKHFFRTSFEKMLKARQIIDDINKWSKTKILLGIEADIINENGDLDIDDDTLALLDILIVGYHRMIPTNFAGYFGGQKNTSEAIEKATRAYLNAIDKYPVTFISHIDSILTTDLYRIGMACRDKGVYIEINNRHTKWTQSQIDDLIASDCMFVVSSDAHRFEDVGNAENAFELIKKYKIPEESVANVAFADEELTEDDKENRLYKNLYNSLRETNPKLYAEITATMGKQAEKSYSRAGAKGALSKEMEDELEKLAREQGIEDYERQDGNESITNYSQENYFEESSNAESEKQDFEGEVDLKNDNYFESESTDYPGRLEDVNTENNEVYEEQTEQESVQENVSNKPSFHSHIEINPSKNDAFKQQSNEEVLNIQNTMNQYKFGLNPNRSRDGSYQDSNNQEEQVQMLKTFEKDEFAKEKKDYEYEQTNNDFFGDDFGSENFNVNVKAKQRPSSSVEINKNYSYGGQKINNKPTGQNFYNGSTFDKTESQNNEKQVVEQSDQQQNSKKSNGFVNFSGFIDDDK